MTYQTYEESPYSGNPIELYEFARGTAEYWRYTSSDTDQSYFGFVYEAVSIERNSFESSQNVEAVALTIKMPVTVEFPQIYIAAPPSDPISFTLRRFHGGDTEVVSIWIGRVVNVEFKEENVEITCESVYTSLKRPTLRRLYQRPCPHVLYSQAVGSCNADQNTFKVVGTLSAVSGTIITSSTFGGYADGYFTGGFVEIVSGGHTNRRYITAHTGNNITLNLQLTGAAVGLDVDAYPGCAHNLNDCNTKFNNILNYGGMPWIPDKNPMSGTRVF
jgi:uncharacterized phage protein (TIGR02218 family)